MMGGKKFGMHKKLLLNTLLKYSLHNCSHCIRKIRLYNFNLVHCYSKIEFQYYLASMLLRMNLQGEEKHQNKPH